MSQRRPGLLLLQGPAQIREGDHRHGREPVLERRCRPQPHRHPNEDRRLLPPPLATHGFPIEPYLYMSRD